MAYQLSREAIADLESIYRHGRWSFGKAQAEKYAAELRRTIDAIARFPEAARLRTEISPPVRACPSGSHMIVYSIENGIALILRIRHSAEDWTSDPL